MLFGSGKSLNFVRKHIKKQLLLFEMGDLLFRPFILVGRNWLAQSRLNSGWRFLRFPIARGHAGILQFPSEKISLN